MAGDNAAVTPGIRRHLLAGALILALPLTVPGCRNRVTADRGTFVGKWKSSRILTPFLLHENGTWEILRDDGEVLEYGVWQYQDDEIMWTYKIDLQVRHERNKVVSANPREFVLRETNGDHTTFVRLD